jgi:hypothetical protein
MVTRLATMKKISGLAGIAAAVTGVAMSVASGMGAANANQVGLPERTIPFTPPSVTKHTITIPFTPPSVKVSTLPTVTLPSVTKHTITIPFTLPKFP